MIVTWVFLCVLLASAILGLIGAGASLRVIKQYERGVVFRFGKARDKVHGPGLTMIAPFIDRLYKVTMQVITMPVPAQDGITRDNVTVRVDAVVYFRVVDPMKVIVDVEDYQSAIRQVALASLRSIIGKSDLDDLLSNREHLNQGLELMIDSPALGWGVHIDRVEIKDVTLPESMKRSMSRQAEAERERRSRVITAEGELQASRTLAEAAEVMAEHPAALQLRLLQTVVEVAAEKNSTLVLPFPVELLRFLERATPANPSAREAAANKATAAPPPGRRSNADRGTADRGNADRSIRACRATAVDERRAPRRCGHHRAGRHAFRRRTGPMSPRTRPAPIVVGVDAGGTATGALCWAAVQAAAQHCPLRIVHVFQPPTLIDPYGLIPWAEVGLVQARAAAEQLLREAAARAWSIAPDTSVSPLLQFGAPGRELLVQAANARLLVVGTGGRRGMRGLLTGSVSAHVARRSSCPTVVIRPSRSLDLGRDPRRIVVGVGAMPSCSPALGFALRAARERGVGLTVVHAWSPDTPSDVDAVRDDPSAAEYLGLCAMERALQPWQVPYPDVPVRVKIVQDDPARALIAESVHAALVVVGSRGTRRLPGTLDSSRSRIVSRHAESPVAIISEHYVMPGAGIPWACLPNRLHHRLIWRRKGAFRPRTETS